jgi:uracil-DNA glycosylase family protein
MTHILLEHGQNPEQLFEDWRFKAREALVRGITPADIDFEDPNDTATLRLAFSADSAAPPHPRTPHPEPHVPAGFMNAAQNVGRHADPSRWNLLYRLLWRLQDDFNLLRIHIDPDVMALRRMERELPEPADLQLLKKASARVEDAAAIFLQPEKLPSAAPYVPARHTMTALREALPRCKGCDLHCAATQAVCGTGSTHPLMMLIGEMPSDADDKLGIPFSGPAGKLLHSILDELRIEPDDVYLTTAVKHFSFEQRGKARVSQAPRAVEVNACKPWLLAELDALRPEVIVCLGAVASKSILGSGFALMRQRGQLIDSPHAPHVIATVHPSAVLRAQGRADAADTAAEEAHYRLLSLLKQDLAFAYTVARHAALKRA